MGIRDDGGRLHPTCDLKGLANDPPQVAGVERLGEVVVGALLHRLDGGVGRPGDRDEDDGGPQAHPADLPVDLQAGLIGQAGVQKDDVGPASAGQFEPLGSGGGELDPMLRRGERLPQRHQARGRVIVDE